MENLGEWIYFIVLAVIGISSVISGKKKKNAEVEAGKSYIPPEVVTPETASDRDFWDVLSEQLDVPVKPKQPTQPKTRKQSPAPQSVKSPAPSPFLRGESDIEKAIRKQGEGGIFKEEQEAEPLVTAEDFRDPESLRKAVIYSEILNRKY